MTPEDLVMRRVAQAQEAGIDGVVASAMEAEKIRARVADNFLIVTPGIRMAGDDVGDQKRIATPANALGDGASHIVVGRPITQAADPKAAALRVLGDVVKPGVVGIGAQVVPGAQDNRASAALTCRLEALL